MSRLYLTWISVLLAGSLSACTYQVAHFTLASTKNIGEVAQVGEYVESEACTDYLLLPWIHQGGAPLGRQMQTATNNALQGKKENLLVGGEITNVHWTIIIWTQNCYKVRGRIVTADFGKK